MKENKLYQCYAGEKMFYKKNSRCQGFCIRKKSFVNAYSEREAYKKIKQSYSRFNFWFYFVFKKFVNLKITSKFTGFINYEVIAIRSCDDNDNGGEGYLCFHDQMGRTMTWGWEWKKSFGGFRLDQN